MKIILLESAVRGEAKYLKLAALILILILVLAPISLVTFHGLDYA
jgi:hypothetical protein